MEAMYEAKIYTDRGEKKIQVYHADITKFDEPVDILTISCFQNDYMPVSGTVVGALEKAFQLRVSDYAKMPEIDLKAFGNVWLSGDLQEKCPYSRIGCIEMSRIQGMGSDWENNKDNILSILHTYFQMLEMATGRGIKAQTVALPVLGAGNQGIDMDFITIPLLNECINFLKSCRQVKRICIIEYSPNKAFRMARALEESYQIKNNKEDYVKLPNGKNTPQKNGKVQKESDNFDIFMSYSSKDFEIMKKLSAILEERGAKVWYAPRNIWGEDYASSIVNAIEKSAFFVALISQNSMGSRHVLNEIDLAFNSLASENHLLPVKLDEAEMPSSFLYYLSRLQWYPVSGSQDEKCMQFADRVMEAVRKAKGEEIGSSDTK